MTPPDDLERWLEQTLRQGAPAPSADLLQRVLAIPAQPVLDERFDFAALFTTWQKALAGGAVFASLLLGVLVGQGQNLPADSSDWVSQDIPGLSYSPSEWGSAQ